MVPEEKRNCQYCELKNKVDLILYCPLYHDLRQTLFEKVHVPDLDLISVEDEP